MALPTANNNKKIYLHGVLFFLVVLFISPNFIAAQTSSSLPQNFARSIYCAVNNFLGIKSCEQSVVLSSADNLAGASFIPIEDGVQPQIIQNITQPIIERTIHTKEIIKQVLPEKAINLKTTEQTLAQFGLQLDQLSRTLYQTSSSSFDDTALWRAIAQMNVVSVGSGVNTDNQTLSAATYNTSTKELSISIENGNSVTVDLSDLIDDADANATNEIQALSLIGNNLSISATSTAIDLSTYLDDTNLTELQVDAFVADNGFLTSEVDGSVLNEIQDLQLSGNSLTITGNGTATTIDLSPYLDNTDTLSDLNCISNEIAKWNGSAWGCSTDASGTGGTDDQIIDAFNLSGDTLSLSLEGDGEAVKTVDLSSYAKGADLHDAITLSGAFDYLTLVGQDIVRGAIDLASDITGTLSIGNGGTGATTTALARSNLGLAIGANVQAFDSDTSLIGQTIETAEITNGTILDVDLNLTDITLSDFTNDQSFISDGNSNWDNSYGFITSANDTVSGAELDGVFSASGLLTRTGVGTYSSLSDNSANWNTAFGWGDHASEGYLTGITGQSIKSLSDVYSSMSPTDGQVLTYDTTNGWQSETLPAGADHLGNHTATQALNLNGNWLSGDGDAEGVFVDGVGRVGIGTSSSLVAAFEVAGEITYLGSKLVGTEKAALELGTGRTGSGFAHIDLVGDTTYTDYGLRMIRNNDGANANSAITHRGTGYLTLQTEDASPIRLVTNGGEKVRIDSSGNVGIGTVTPAKRLQVYGTSSDPVRITNSLDANWNRIQFNKPSRMWSAGQDNSTGFTICDETGGVCRVAITSSGNVGFGTSPNYPLHMASGAHVTAGGSWTNASSRDLKENFVSLNSMDILTGINALDISQWNYKVEDSSILHIGPIAQDFFAEFGLGGSDVSISTIDTAGVSLIGIQALSQKFDDLFEGFSITEDSTLLVPNIEAEKITAKTICLGSTCINEYALRDLIDLEPLSEVLNVQNNPVEIIDQVEQNLSENDAVDSTDPIEEISVQDEAETLEVTATSTATLSEEPDPIGQATSTDKKIIEHEIIDDDKQTSDETPVKLEEVTVKTPVSEDLADDTEILKLQLLEPEPINQPLLIDIPQAEDNVAALIN